jgi:hypothetical protein
MTPPPSIASIVERQVSTLGEGQAFVIFTEGKSEAAYFRALSRLVKTGKLVRIEKGKYYKPVKNRFGIIRPSETELIKTLTQRGSETVGYLTGSALYNQWGLTTQVPNTITIARRSRLPEKDLNGYKVKFAVRPFSFIATDVPLLQLLDVLTDIRRIPDAAPASIVPLLVARMRELSSGQLERLIQLALNYPPSTRALLGVMLETYFPAQDTKHLQGSLNPLTKFRLKGLETVVADKAKWNFK